MSKIPLQSTVSLVSQIAVLGLLAVAMAFKNRGRHRHGITMTAAVALHLSTVVAVMAPSFSGFIRRGKPLLIDVVTVIVFAHVVLGLVALVLGIWLVTKWRLKIDVGPCFARKKVMKVTFALWITALALGVIIYIAYWIGSPTS